MKTMNITGNKFKFLLLPILIIIVGIVMYFVHGGFNFDIEFMGGIRMQVDMEQSFSNEEVASFLEEKSGITPITVQAGNGSIATIKFQKVENGDEEEVKNLIFSSLKEKYGLSSDAPLSANSASASFGGEVQRKAFTFTLIAIICILIYIAFRFEWRSAVMAVIALALNILVMLAVYAISYTPLNTTFIAAMLTIIGYSINNTIVVFDRIRENMKGFRAKKNGAKVSEVVNRSIAESMGRTLNTTITTLITIVLLYFLGVSAIKEFAFPLIIGVLIGAYSSIFIASPFWAAWKEAELEGASQK